MLRALPFLCVVLAACATKLRPDAERIRLTDNPEVVKGCRFVANVEGGDQSMTRMKNQAAELKANTIYLLKGVGNGAKQHGEAYDCPAGT